MLCDPDWRILKPAHLLKQHLAGIEPGQEHSAAARPEIDSDVERVGHPMPFCGLPFLCFFAALNNA
jgi:hypothetical protein